MEDSFEGLLGLLNIRKKTVNEIGQASVLNWQSKVRLDCCVHRRASALTKGNAGRVQAGSG